MEMLTYLIGANTTYIGSDVYILSANDHFKIKVGNDEKYSEQCPAGKKQVVTISVTIKEENV